MIGDDQYASSYTKKAQITSYFGFTIWEDICNPKSKRKITESGRRMYEAIKANNTVQVQEVLMNALETVKFGRNNYGCPDSNSDIEPPALYIRTILELGYLTYHEFAFMLWKLEDIGANYTDTLNELKNLRALGKIELDKNANKYADCKPIMILVRWNFLSEDKNNTVGGKHIIIAPEVLNKYRKRLSNLKIYNIDMDCDKSIIDKSDKSNDKIENKREEYRNDTGNNIILYGVPGVGKSWIIEHEYCNNEEYMERVVFHPDYMYSDFVGQILPVLKDDNRVGYEFVPGPFTNLLKQAYYNPSKSYYLIIEEINRGNAPAIFGEIFQLLDRKDEDEYDKNGKLLYKKGTSEYSISNANIAYVIYGEKEHKIRIPANMSILGTMNTSDQNVFTLDTAFQRRWTMRLIPNSFINHKFADNKILDTDVSWRHFCEIINNEILRKNDGISFEDKRIGAYFISASDLKIKNITKEMDEKEKIQVKHDNNRFAEKVLKYLWDDAFKFSHEDIFNTNKFNSFEKIIEGFMSSVKIKNERFRIFNNNIRSLILNENISVLDYDENDVEKS